MRGADLGCAGQKIRVASWGADATSDDAAAVGAVRPGTHEGHWKITQYMYPQMPEQPGGDCSDS